MTDQSGYTNRQIDALKFYVAFCPKAVSFATAAVLYLIERSERLTQAVSLSIIDCDWGEAVAASVQNGVHNMLSCGNRSPVRLGLFLERIGIEVQFAHASGIFGDAKDAPFMSSLPGRTIWIIPGPHRGDYTAMPVKRHFLSRHLDFAELHGYRLS